MNIQIFGVAKCFDTKKAERYFKERRIRVQMIDLKTKGMSMGELKSVAAAVGFTNLIDIDSPKYKESVAAYISDPERKLQALCEAPQLLRTPIVRNGRQATVGYKPEIWQSWE